jgi:Protein of unknown function (DUF1194)
MVDLTRLDVRKSSHSARRPFLAAAAWLAALVAQPFIAGAAFAGQPVDLELILAIDVSGSIDPDEARLQRRGYEQALVSAEVIQAIKAGATGRIAVAYAEWAGLGYYKVVVDWTLVDGLESAKAFVGRLAAQPITTAHRTSVSGAIDQSVPLFAANDYDATRRVIDISGDGANNYGRLVTDARDAAVKQGITINGLPIMGDPNGVSQPSNPDLDLFYRDCVIGGPGAFYVVARGFDDFARAVRKKLILEVAGRTPDDDRPTQAMLGGPERLWRAAGEDKRRSPPCDIGERGWMSIIQGGTIDR